MNIIETIKKTIFQHQLIAYGDTIVVGISGGADSVTLLLLLGKLRYELGLNLIAVHINHGLRKEAKKDQLFVENLCSKINVPCLSQTFPQNFLKKQRGSLEEVARTKRLSILTGVARTFHADAVALGHHRDDLAETILMRILRGTGLQGLQAILPKRRLNGVTFIRPLLDISRTDIENFLKRSSVSFRTDSTNKKTIFFRNKVRRELLPLLEKNYNPSIKDTLANLTDTAAIDYDFISTVAQKISTRILKKTAGTLQLSLKDFSKLHLSLRRALLRLAIEQLQGDTNRLTLQHFYEIEGLMNNRPVGTTVHLPQKLFVKKNKKYLILGIRKS